MKILLVILMVILFLLALVAIFNPLELKYRASPETVSINVEPDSMASKDARRVKGDEQWRNEIAFLKSQQAVLDAQLSAYNKRIDDIFVFGGLIITLLLAIIASVYIKAEQDIENHFKKNFGIYKEKAEGILNDVRQYSITSKTQLGILISYAKKKLEGLSLTSQETEDGEIAPQNHADEPPDQSPSNTQHDKNEA